MTLARSGGAEAIHARARRRGHRHSDASLATPPLRLRAARRSTAATPRPDTLAVARRTTPSSATRRGAPRCSARAASVLPPTINATSEPVAIRIKSGFAVRRIGQYVCAAPQAVGGGKLRAIERRHVLPRQHQRHRPVARFQRDAPGDGGLVGIAGTNDDRGAEPNASRRVVRPADAWSRPRPAQCCRA